MKNLTYSQNSNVLTNLRLFCYGSNNVENPGDQVQNNQAQGVWYQKVFPQNFQDQTFIFSQAHNRFMDQNQNQNQKMLPSNQQAAPTAVSVRKMS